MWRAIVTYTLKVYVIESGVGVKGSDLMEDPIKILHVQTGHSKKVSQIHSILISRIIVPPRRYRQLVGEFCTE